MFPTLNKVPVKTQLQMLLPNSLISSLQQLFHDNTSRPRPKLASPCGPFFKTFVCLSVCLSVCVCVHARIYICVCMYLYTCTYADACVLACTCAHVCMCSPICMCAHVSMDVYGFVFVSANMCIHVVCTCVYVYILGLSIA